MCSSGDGWSQSITRGHPPPLVIAVGSHLRLILLAGTILACREGSANRVPIETGAASAAGASLSSLDSATESSSRDSYLFVQDTNPSCRSCIELRPLVTIGALSDSLSSQRLPQIVRDSRGTVYAADVGLAYYTDILIYDSAGRFTDILGRRGEGPGEFPFPIQIALGPGDSVLVLHPPRRISVFAPDGRYVRGVTISMFATTGMLLLPSGEMILGGRVYTPEAAGLPLHLVSSDGRVLRSFGSENVMTIGGSPDPLFVHGSNGTLWHAERRNYRIEQLDHEGRTRRVIVGRLAHMPGFANLDSAIQVRRSTPPRRRPHLTPQTRPKRLERPPRSQVAGLYEDAQRRLWVLLHVPVANWQEIELMYDPRSTEGRLADFMHDRLLQTVIDVIDPATGELLARHSRPGRGFLANDGSFYHPLVTPEGLIRVEVLSLHLQSH